MPGYIRRRCGWVGSVIFHLLVFLLLSFSGVLNAAKIHSAITEIAIVGGGGGGGGGGNFVGINDGPLAAELPGNISLPEDAGEASAMEEKPIEDGISDIVEQKKQTAQARQHKATPRASAQGNGVPNVATRSGGSGSGYGGGHGTGYGVGTGSGIGAGTGSGSGGGQGSGHGTGTGSGVGAGTSPSFNPAVPPRITRSVAPAYPESQRRANVEGVSVVRLLIGTNGRVEEATVLSTSGNTALDAAAVQATKQWSFTAAKNSLGQKVRCYYDMPIRFSLR